MRHGTLTQTLLDLFLDHFLGRLRMQDHQGSIESQRWIEEKKRVGFLEVLMEKKDIGNIYTLRPDAAAAIVATPPSLNGLAQGSVQRAQILLEQQQQQQGVGTTGFALQLVQRGLEESLGAVQRSIHEEVQNLHLELLRQFHIQQMEMGSMMDTFQAKQAELAEEIKALRRENQQLRDLY